MAGFAERGDPYPEGNCHWCGSKLRHRDLGDGIKAAKAGPYQDDAFCTLNCGYQFGLQMVENGRRLKVKAS